jgi:hypothetical protein
MNINTIPVDVIDPATTYGQQVPVVAEVVKIVKEASSYSLVKIRDFTGKEIQTLIGGRTRPTLQHIGQVIVLQLSAVTKGQYTNYSGFYNPSDIVPQQYTGKRPPVPTGGQQATGSGGTKTGGSFDNGKNRGFAMSYAKDLVVAGVVTMKQLQITTLTIAEYLDTGKFPGKPQAVAQPTFQPTTQIEQAVEQAAEREVGEVYAGVDTGPQAAPVETEFASQYGDTGGFAQEDTPF